MVVVLLRQVPSPYNALLELFRQRIDRYSSLDSTLRNTLIGHLIFARCLHCLPKMCAEPTWQKE